MVVAAGNYGRLSVYGSNGLERSPLRATIHMLSPSAREERGTPLLRRPKGASYSSKGPTTYDHVVKPDIMAEGNGIISLAAQGRR